jgi:prevent-host-death family protein
MLAATPGPGSQTDLDMDYLPVPFLKEIELLGDPERANPMRISITDAKSQLTALVRRAEAGEEIILTRHGRAAVRLVPLKSMPDPKARRRLLEAVQRSGAAGATSGPSAARSQDFLYGEDGLPE